MGNILYLKQICRFCFGFLLGTLFVGGFVMGNAPRIHSLLCRCLGLVMTCPRSSRITTQKGRAIFLAHIQFLLHRPTSGAQLLYQEELHVVQAITWREPPQLASRLAGQRPEKLMQFVLEGLLEDHVEDFARQWIIIYCIYPLW